LVDKAAKNGKRKEKMLNKIIFWWLAENEKEGTKSLLTMYTYVVINEQNVE
jgi:hypothetical protein